MKFKFDVDFNGSLDSVLHVLASTSLAERRAHALHIEDYTFSSNVNSAGETESVLDARIGATLLPEQLQSFVKNGIEGRIAATQHRNGSGSAAIEHTVNINGAPVKVAFTVSLRENGSITHGHYDGEFSVNIPFIGKTIEQKISSYIDDVIVQDAQLVNQELA